MKKNIICLGLGKNQLNLIKYLIKDFNIIGIDRSNNSKVKKFFHRFYKSSIYDFRSINRVAKDIIKKKIKIFAIIYRSSGPTILSAALLESKFQINRINKDLKYSIYSKSYFSKFLKKNKLNFLPSNTIKYSKLSKRNGEYILKPDAPISGKKNVFLIKNKLSYKNFIKCKIESHNNKVNYSKFFNGKDISSFYVVNNNKNINCLISHVEEFNTFKNGKLFHHGMCAPPIINYNNILYKKEKVDKSIIKLFNNFYGIISISSKILKNHSILPYEVNIGLSGDKFADVIFPYLFRNRSLYKIEIDMALFKTKKNMNYNSKKFIGFFKNKKIMSKNNFLRKINKYNF